MKTDKFSSLQDEFRGLWNQFCSTWDQDEAHAMSAAMDSVMCEVGESCTKLQHKAWNNWLRTLPDFRAYWHARSEIRAANSREDR